MDWDLCIVSIAKTGSIKIGILIFSLKFIFSDFVLYLYKSSIRPANVYLDMPGEIQKVVDTVAGPKLAAVLEPWTHSRNKASVSSLFYKGYFVRYY